jgi:hypothetical protein
MFGFLTGPTSRRALGAGDGARPDETLEPTPSLRDFASITPVEGRSILGRHGGILPNDLMDILEGKSA